MFRRTCLTRYVKPPQGFLRELPKPDYDFRRRRHLVANHIGNTGDAVPRRSHIDFAQQEEAKIQAAASEVAAASASVTENTWASVDPVEAVGVNAESYGKWFCEKYGLSRDEYEAVGCANLLAHDKQRVIDAHGEPVPAADGSVNSGVDAAVMEELLASAPRDVMEEAAKKEVHLRFAVETLQGDGPEPEVVEAVPEGDVHEAEQSLEDAPRLEHA